MKRSFFFLIVLLLAAGTAVSAGGEWSVLSVSAEKARVEKLGVLPVGPGNAADLYLPYLKDEAPITKEPWFTEISLSMLNEPEEGDAEKLSTAGQAASADLAVLLQASAIKESKVWGPYWKPDLSKNVLEQDAPRYINLLRLGEIMMAQGEQLQKTGNNEGAAERFIAVFRVGNHLEAERDVLGYSIGLLMKKEAAKRLAALYNQTGDQAKAQLWSDYLKTGEARIEARKKFYNEQEGTPSWDQAQVEKFVRDPDMPFPLRFDLLMSRHYCLHDKIMFARCLLIGAPGWVTDLEDEFAKQDELSKLFIEHLRAYKSQLSWLQWVEEIK